MQPIDLPPDQAIRVLLGLWLGHLQALRDQAAAWGSSGVRRKVSISCVFARPARPAMLPFAVGGNHCGPLRADRFTFIWRALPWRTS